MNALRSSPFRIVVPGFLAIAFLGLLILASQPAVSVGAQAWDACNVPVLDASGSIYDDNFDSGALNTAKWRWENYPNTNVPIWNMLTGGGSDDGLLSIRTKPTDIWAYNNGAPKLLQYLNPEDTSRFLLQTDFFITATQNFHQADLIVYQDDDNFVRATFAYNEGGHRVEFIKEFLQSRNYLYTNPGTNPAASNIHVWLRIYKYGTNYTGCFSLNGSNFQPIGSGTHSAPEISPRSVGILAMHGYNSTASPVYVNFNNFSLKTDAMLEPDPNPIPAAATPTPLTGIGLHCIQTYGGTCYPDQSEVTAPPYISSCSVYSETNVDIWGGSGLSPNLIVAVDCGYDTVYDQNAQQYVNVPKTGCARNPNARYYVRSAGSFTAQGIAGLDPVELVFEAGAVNPVEKTVMDLVDQSPSETVHFGRTASVLWSFQPEYALLQPFLLYGDSRPYSGTVRVLTGTGGNTSSRASYKSSVEYQAWIANCIDEMSREIASVVSADLRGTHNTHKNLSAFILGSSDCSNYLSLGGGSLVLDMGAGKEFSDGPGHDLVVFMHDDLSAEAEIIRVSVSDSPYRDWVVAGESAAESSGQFRLDLAGLSDPLRRSLFRYIKIDDTTPNVDPARESPGADICGVQTIWKTNQEYPVSGNIVDIDGNVQQDTDVYILYNSAEKIGTAPVVEGEFQFTAKPGPLYLWAKKPSSQSRLDRYSPSPVVVTHPVQGTQTTDLKVAKVKFYWGTDSLAKSRTPPDPGIGKYPQWTLLPFDFYIGKIGAGLCGKEGYPNYFPCNHPGITIRNDVANPFPTELDTTPNVKYTYWDLVGPGMKGIGCIANDSYRNWLSIATGLSEAQKDAFSLESLSAFGAAQADAFMEELSEINSLSNSWADAQGPMLFVDFENPYRDTQNLMNNDSRCKWGKVGSGGFLPNQPKYNAWVLDGFLNRIIAQKGRVGVYTNDGSFSSLLPKDYQFPSQTALWLAFYPGTQLPWYSEVVNRVTDIFTGQPITTSNDRIYKTRLGGICPIVAQYWECTGNTLCSQDGWGEDDYIVTYQNPNNLTPHLYYQSCSAPPSIILTGLAVKGAIGGASVHLYQYNPDGETEPITYLADQRTQSNGRFSIEIISTDNLSGSIIAEVTGGFYTDEATGDLVSADGSSLYAAVYNVDPDQPVSVAVTPFTDIAFRLARQRLAADPQLAPADVAGTNAEVAELFGLRNADGSLIDIIAVMPADLAAGGELSRDDPAVRYALAIAGLSQQAADAGVDPETWYAQLAADAEDGQWDGGGEPELNTAIEEYLAGPHSPFPTPTPTNTPTSTPTETPTDTRTPTSTATPTETPANEPTLEPSQTLSPTSTETATDTPTPSWTPITPENTPEGTPDPGTEQPPTDTETPTPTPTSTGTASETPSATYTPTETHTPTATSTDTPTRTPSHTPTDTSTLTPSATATATSTDTPSPTRTPTTTSTRTPSPTPTEAPSRTATARSTDTPTPAWTPSATPTLTKTPTPSETSAPSSTLTPSPTAPGGYSIGGLRSALRQYRLEGKLQRWNYLLLDALLADAERDQVRGHPGDAAADIRLFLRIVRVEGGMRLLDPATAGSLTEYANAVLRQLR